MGQYIESVITLPYSVVYCHNFAGWPSFVIITKCVCLLKIWSKTWTGIEKTGYLFITYQHHLCLWRVSPCLQRQGVWTKGNFAKGTLFLAEPDQFYWDLSTMVLPRPPRKSWLEFWKFNFKSYINIQKIQFWISKGTLIIKYTVTKFLVVLGVR